MVNVDMARDVVDEVILCVLTAAVIVVDEVASSVMMTKQTGQSGRQSLVVVNKYILPSAKIRFIFRYRHPSHSSDIFRQQSVQDLAVLHL